MSKAANTKETKGGTGAAPPAASSTISSKGGGSAAGAKVTTPHDVFLLCIERAENLLKIHKTAHGSQSRPESYLSDAHRAAIVLAISALDAFVRTFAIDKVRELWAESSKALPSALSDQLRQLLKDDQIIESARKDELLSKTIKSLTQHFETKSFQGVKNISSCMQLVGYEDVFHQVAIKASINEDQMKEELGRFTKRRHAIAHQGDHDLSQNPPTLNPIRKKDAEDCIKMVKTIAKAINSLS